jgi:hypothetical protein
MKNLVFILSALVLCSCANMNYGVLTEVAPSTEVILAQDCVKQIGKVKLPARTTLRISQKTSSPFGRHLLDELRQRGFGIQEVTNYNIKTNFSYVIDKVSGGNSIRVTLWLEEKMLSRAYLVKSGKLIPIGAWTVKE